MKFLPPDDVCRLEPLIAPDIGGAVCIAEEAQILPMQLVEAYAQAAAKFGASLFEGTEVIALQQAQTGHRVTGILTSRGEAVVRNHLVIAAGAWAAQCGSWLNVVVPVRPVRGQSIVLRQPSSSIRRIIFDEGIYDEDIYIAPKPYDVVIVGATKDEVGFDTAAKAGGAIHLLGSATRLTPALSSCPIIHKSAGLRPKGKQSYPLLGQIPSWENVTVASGHGGFGIFLSAITGEAVSELITRGQLPEHVYP